MTRKLFNRDDLLRIEDLDYCEFDERSRQMINKATEFINSKYHKHYLAPNAVGIEHDGSENWFYIGFPDDTTILWYLISGGKYDSPNDDEKIFAVTNDELG